MAIQLMVDSAADISLEQAENMGIMLLPMTVTIDDRDYVSGFELSAKEFYTKLEKAQGFPTTSQISPAIFEEAFRNVLNKGDTPIMITLSSRLSGTYQSACIAAEAVGGTVFVVDSMNATLGEAILAYYAHGLIKQGLDAQEIVDTLNRVKERIRVFGMVDTLEFLKKGGRISATTAVIGSVLSIKPVLGVVDGEVLMLAKARGVKNGYKLLNSMLEDGEGIDFSKPMAFGYAGLETASLEAYMEACGSIFGDDVKKAAVLEIGAVIGAHLGPGTIAIAFFEAE